MADMREFERIPPTATPSPDQVLTALTRRAEAANEARREIGSLVGVAESEDQLVRVTVGSEGLRELTIDPWAMRKKPEELAQLILAAANAAREDLVGRRLELTQNLGVAGPEIDLDESLVQLERLRSMVAVGQEDLRGVYERFRRESGQ